MREMLTQRFSSGPEVEQRIQAYQQEHGQVLFGGHHRNEIDTALAHPDNIGLSLPNSYAQIGK